MEAGFKALKYITNPYALIGFVIIIIAFVIVKIKAGNKFEQDVDNGDGGNEGGNQINVNGYGNKLSKIKQSVNNGDDSSDK